MAEKVTYHPMPGKIVAKVRTTEQRNGIILLSDPAHSRVAEVIAVFEPFTLHLDSREQETEPYVAVGDIIVFGRHSGTEMTVGSEKVIVLKEGEILTKIIVEEVPDA